MAEQRKEGCGSLVSGLCDQIVPFTYVGEPACLKRTCRVLGDTVKFETGPLLIYSMCFFTVVYIGQEELSGRTMLDEGKLWSSKGT